MFQLYKFFLPLRSCNPTCHGHVKVAGVEGVDLQATAVWTSSQPPQYLEQTTLLQELRLRLSEHLFRTTKEEQYKTNPLAGAGDLCVPGTVVEFISQEVGLIRLESTQDTALFHLEQVSIFSI